MREIKPEDLAALDPELREAILGVVNMLTFRALEYCPQCKKDMAEVDMAKDFKDAVSVKEFGLSGLCQKCQDDFFGGDEL